MQVAAGLTLWAPSRMRVGRADDVGDREAADEAELARLRHVPGGDARDVGALVIFRLEGAEIRQVDDAGAMLEGDFGEARRHLLHRRSQREAGAEDQLVAGRGELAEHPLGILRHEDVVDDGDRDLVAELRLDGVDAERMLLGPADLGDRRCVDLPDLQRLLGAHDARESRCCRAQSPSAPVYFRNSRLVVLIIVVTL